MSGFPKKQREFLRQVVAMAEANPFGPHRPQAEAAILGMPKAPLLLRPESLAERETGVSRINKTLEDCLEDLRDCLEKSSDPPDLEDLELYRSGVWIWTYHSFRQPLDDYIARARALPGKNPKMGGGIFEEFQVQILRFFYPRGQAPQGAETLEVGPAEMADLFAFCFQLRRALKGTLERIVGISPSALSLRAAVWEAIVTRRLIWSFRYLKERMANFSTLILGESGTGKDLVAESIGTSQFIPYLPKEDRFAIDAWEGYRAVNLSALTPTLIESELFGHLKGAFTGAESDRIGHLERCSAHGALFLDEIGDLSAEVQVKLLRVLQSREFYPLGSGAVRHFSGRILSATNRDPAQAVAEGRLREDFLYRIGAHVIRVPNLATRFSEAPEESAELLTHLLHKVLGRVDSQIYREIESKVAPLIEAGYPWPGNVRELEQCVRTLLVSSTYEPLVPPGGRGGEGPLADLFARMEMAQAPLAEVLALYCRHTVSVRGTLQGAGEALGVDWRTVRKHADS
jgi:hypothetical protein